jgi:hypothetical protein
VTVHEFQALVPPVISVARCASVFGIHVIPNQDSKVLSLGRNRGE